METKTISLKGVHRRMYNHGAPFYGLLDTRRALETYPMDMDVDWQRDHVWTEKQKQLFIGHVLEGGEVQPLIVNEGVDGYLVPAQLIDGKQRMTAALDWEEGRIAALISDGREILAADLDKASRTKCSNSIGLQYAMVRLTREGCLELYLRLNRGGTVHTDDEIGRVRELLAKERGEQ